MKKHLHLLLVFLLPFLSFGQTWEQIGQNIIGETSSQLGYSSSMSSDGNIVAVGAPFYSTNKGAVYVYQYNGTSWEQLGQSMYATATEYFGNAVSLSADGKTLVAGSYWASSKKGLIRIYHFDGTSWVQQGADIPGEVNGGQFGNSTSISADGNTVAVGAYKASVGSGFYNNGAVYVYRYNGSEWARIGQTLTGEISFTGAYGNSVAMNSDGNRMVVGAPGWSAGDISDQGKAFVYQYNADGNTWELLGDQNLVLEGDYSSMNNHVGVSVSMNADGTVVAAGGYQGGGGSYSYGHAVAYKYNGTSWDQLGQTIFGTAENDFLGFKVSLSGAGDIMAVAVPGSDAGGADQSAVNIYKYNGTEWAQLGNSIFSTETGNGNSNNVGISMNSAGDRIAAPFSYVENKAGLLRMFKYVDPTLNVADLRSKEFTYYPNPVKDLLHFNAAGTDIRSVQVYDMTGRLVFGQNASKAGLSVINISSLKTGTYLVKVNTDKDTKSFKIIKQ